MSPWFMVVLVTDYLRVFIRLESDSMVFEFLGVFLQIFQRFVVVVVHVRSDFPFGRQIFLKYFQDFSKDLLNFNWGLSWVGISDLLTECFGDYSFVSIGGFWSSGCGEPRFG